MNGSMQTHPRWLRGLLLAPGLLALAVTFILPLIWLGRISVLPRSGDGVSLPGFTLQAYQHVLGDRFYWWVVLKTVWLGVLTAALERLAATLVVHEVADASMVYDLSHAHD